MTGGVFTTLFHWVTSSTVLPAVSHAFATDLFAAIDINGSLNIEPRELAGVTESVACWDYHLCKVYCTKRQIEEIDTCKYLISNRHDAS